MKYLSTVFAYLAVAHLMIAPVVSVATEKLNPRAYQYMPVLCNAIDMLWPDMPQRSYFGGQIDKETCISQSHKKCWNPNTELKTSLEYGFGFSQFTIAYDKQGKQRFNSWEETKAMNKAVLGQWKWEDRYSAEMQLKAQVIKNKFNWARLKFPIADEANRMAFFAVTWNGGLPIKDIQLCRSAKGCDPTYWYGHVEHYSNKSRVPQPGYGKSFFEISRDYPRDVEQRRQKYIPYLENRCAGV